MEEPDARTRPALTVAQDKTATRKDPKRMPNWCDNELLVTGTVDELDRLSELVGTEPAGADQESRNPYRYDQTTPFFLGAIVPSSQDEDKWEGKRMVRWGTLREVGNTAKRSRINLGENLAVDRWLFTTAWSPPAPVIQALSEKFDQVHIVHSYNESGVSLHGFTIYSQGQLVASWATQGNQLFALQTSGRSLVFPYFDKHTIDEHHEDIHTLSEKVREILAPDLTPFAPAVYTVSTNTAADVELSEHVKLSISGYDYDITAAMTSPQADRLTAQWIIDCQYENCEEIGQWLRSNGPDSQDDERILAGWSILKEANEYAWDAGVFCSSGNQVGDLESWTCTWKAAKASGMGLQAASLLIDRLLERQTKVEDLAGTLLDVQDKGRRLPRRNQARTSRPGPAV